MPRCLATLLLALFLALAPEGRAQAPLPGIGAAREGTTVSGISSGAFMAVQFHVAFSADIAGAGAVAGGPYLCAEGSVSIAQLRCMDAWPVAPDAGDLLRRATALAAFGHIDPVGNLRRSRAYVFGSRNDPTVRLPVVESLVAFYRLAGVAALEVEMHERAGHGFLVEEGAQACDRTGPPFINDCDYDQAGAILRHLLGGPATPPAPPMGRLVLFSQAEFLAAPRRHGLDEAGFLYLPPGCESGGCRVHIVFHGCRQGRERLGDTFVQDTGYLRHADPQRLVLLFPQAAAIPFRNERGCWDFFAYSGPDYHTRQGRQMAAVKRMLERLQSPPPG